MTAPTSTPDLPTVAETRTTLALLAFDGFLCAVLAVLYLPAYLGSTPFPVSILVAAVVNLLLIRGARMFSDRTLVAAVPILGWLFGFGLCMSLTPGGDLLVFADWRTLLLFVAAVVPGLGYLYAIHLRTLIRRAQG